MEVIRNVQVDRLQGSLKLYRRFPLWRNGNILGLRTTALGQSERGYGVATILPTKDSGIEVLETRLDEPAISNVTTKTYR